MHSLQSLLNPDVGGEGSGVSDRKRRHDRAKARYLEEVSYLQEKSRELQVQLDTLESSKKRKADKPLSVWEGFARRQALERQEAQLENGKLKSMLTQQILIIRNLEGVLTQRPQLIAWPTLTVNDLTVTRFPIKIQERKQAFDRLMESEFGCLDEIYRKFGLSDTLDTWKQVVVRIDEATSDIVLDVSFSLIVNVSYDIMAKAMTTIYIPKELINVPNGSANVLELIDDLSVYIQRKYTLQSLPEIHAHFACRAKNMEDRVLCVLASVMDDDAYPYPSHVLRSREHIYSSAEHLNENQSRWKMVRRVHIPASANGQIDLPIGSLVELLLHLYSDNVEILMSRMQDVLRAIANVPLSAVLVEPAGDLIQLNQATRIYYLSSMHHPTVSLRSLLNPEPMPMAPLKASSSSSPTKAPSDRKLRHDRAKARYNDEMAYLTRKRVELTEQIERLEKSKRLKTSKSVWEGFARRQAMERQESMIENSKLKNMLTQQLAILKDLQGVLAERPILVNWPLMPGIEGPMAYLAKDPHMRQTQFLELMDAQASQLNDIFKKHGLLDTVDTWKQIVVRNDGNHVVLEISLSMVVNAPFKLLGKALERVTSCREPRQLDNGYIEPIEIFDSTSQLFRRVTTLPGIPDIVAEFATKCYSYPKQVAFVMNSMFDDEISPDLKSALRSREIMYITSEYWTETKSRCKMYRKVYVPAFHIPGTPPSPSSDNGSPIGTLIEMLLTCYSDNIEAFVRAIYREFQPLLGADNIPESLIENTSGLITFNESAS
ncbi:hypothetical protein THRCLA_02931 [Thraustotheca clavata]|uniref:Uncharacterized protein n=1 Tax=Thraustotheca clavata TaxID=74557 RepID=A0A1W0A3M5_9STRA|nr:hypothetical protein THRCLA_02931 [Thraustotheca clavata]